MRVKQLVLNDRSIYTQEPSLRFRGIAFLNDNNSVLSVQVGDVSGQRLIPDLSVNAGEWAEYFIPEQQYVTVEGGLYLSATDFTNGVILVYVD